jgi:hypothetical protein
MKNFIDLSTWINEEEKEKNLYPVKKVNQKDDIDIKEQSVEVRFMYFLTLYVFNSSPQFKSSIDFSKVHIFQLKENNPILYLNNVFCNEIFFENFNECTGTTFDKDAANEEYFYTLTKQKAKVILKKLKDSIGTNTYYEQLHLLINDFKNTLTVKFEKFPNNADIKGIKIRND